ncbi:hypothetical protein L083_2728 [Actinoplanes sp. N902-109]|nr:hypothetical protein L083_2728 [Actinoplanes sp. N902-109]
MIDQHAGRGAGRLHQRFEAAGKPVREDMIDAGFEDALADLRLLAPAHLDTFSRNWRYV